MNFPKCFKRKLKYNQGLYMTIQLTLAFASMEPSVVTAEAVFLDRALQDPPWGDSRRSLMPGWRKSVNRAFRALSCVLSQCSWKNEFRSQTKDSGSVNLRSRKWDLILTGNERKYCQFSGALLENESATWRFQCHFEGLMHQKLTTNHQQAIKQLILLTHSQYLHFPLHESGCCSQLTFPYF